MSNRLAHAQSPYLLQHQDNPVDWFPWGDEAFERARAEDKPIFLSIGYATCHWCHVMAHESFEDAAVARLMNEAFVNVKLDREERPDIDQLYMTVAQLLNGHGGWPLTIVMTPDKKPFFAGTYFPKETRHGRIGMLDLVPRIQAAWQNKREQLLASADEITDLLRRGADRAGSNRTLGATYLTMAYAQLERRFDAQHGGFGGAPKFPSPHTLLFLLRYWKRTDEAQALRMVTTTLRKMRQGGIYDHVGFGFHRYATDAEWKVPHFEKMLYDQAMLAMAYTEAFEATREAAFGSTAHEVCAYVLRDMTSPEGPFYSAEDADSEGREGKFYLWTTDEVRAALPHDLAELFLHVYHFKEEGNFEDEATRQRTGENIPYLSLAESEEVLGIGEETLLERMKTARQQLFDHREQRIHPGKDDKVLTDWNGLMIAALAKAARAFDEPEYAAAARRATDFILDTLRNEEGRLLHRWRNGDAAIHAALDDYAFLIWGLLELYETTFEVGYLRTAIDLDRQMTAHCWDEAHGAFFLAPDDADGLLVRQKEGYDGALPSGNSIAMLNLIRLGRITGDPRYEERAEAVGSYFAEAVAQMPSGFTAMLVALDFALGPSFEIVVAGEPGKADTDAMLLVLRSIYLPNKVVLLRTSDETPPISEISPYTQTQRAVDEKATAYVCRNFACSAPTTDPSQLQSVLAG